MTKPGEKKGAYPPLLPPGRHRMSMGELHKLAVVGVPGSQARPALFKELERLVADLSGQGLSCQLWIDGSFLTTKLEPDDIDLSFVAHADHMDTLDTGIVDAIFADLNGGKKYSPVLDTYVCIQFRADDKRKPADKTDYWSEKWSVGWDDYLKGFAVIRIGETDVGLRFSS